MTSVWFSFILLGSMAAQAAIFGADNRQLVTETSPVLPLARATAIAVMNSNVSINKSGNLDLAIARLTDFCKDESLFDAPSLSYSCSGFLIAPDLLVTAGHCVYAVNTAHHELKHETKLACEAFAWLFDYQGSHSSEAATKDLNPDRLFRCKEIIYARQTESAPFLDYALIRLDRPALGRTPFKFAASRIVSGSALAMIGYPFGTPATYTDSGRVTLNDAKRDSFLTSLDAVDGNSGGPVFNSAHEIVGILIGGTPTASTYTDPNLKCERINRCSENGAVCKAFDSADVIKQLAGYQGVGSEVQRIQPIIDLIQPPVRSVLAK